MNTADNTYLQLVNDVLQHGERVSNRTGIDTLSLFGYQMRFDLSQGFPALTTKKLAWRSVVAELLWFLEGSDDERRLAEITYGRPRAELVGKNTIWTANADVQGKQLGYPNNDEVKRLGPIYGVQWRSWKAYRPGGPRGGETYDQITDIIKKLRTAPDDRRIILSAWNVSEIHDMALPPCHCFAQFRVYNGKLNCLMYQRSLDVGIGCGFNWASYALLTHIIAREVGLQVGEFVHSVGDAHIYTNHIDALKMQCTRQPFPAPHLVIDSRFCLQDTLNGNTAFDATKSFMLENYQCHPTIQMDMAV